jgi:SHS2 domain-containing protein
MTFEILEHTADVGIRARGATLEEVFEAATRGLADIAGLWSRDDGERTAIEVEAPDLGALLVDWLEEVLWLHDSRDVLFGAVQVDRVGGGRASGSLTLVPRAGAGIAGTQVKAITYHQLRVERVTDSGWVAEVYVDV